MMKKLIILFVFWICTWSSALAVTMTTQQTTLPGYQFQSTSTYSSVVGNSAYTTTTVYAPGCTSPSKGPRRTESWTPGSWENGDGWDDPGEDDYPTGVLPNPAPVGEPLILLVFAILYLIGRQGWRRLKWRT